MIRITIIPSFSRRFDIQNVSDDARRKGAHCTVGLKWEKVISQNCHFTHYIHTVWIFQDFSVSQILREINFEDCKSEKYAISTHLEALIFYFGEFQP